MNNRVEIAVALACLSLAAPLAAQTITEFPLPRDSNPLGIAVGPDGNTWFTQNNPSRIGRVTESGVVTDFPLPEAFSGPWGIAAGPDGNLWFSESGGTDQIGRITTQGAIEEFKTPTVNSTPAGIAAGPDGNLWFVEASGNRVGRITTAGVITEFPVPTAESGLQYITAGADGNLWFTEYFANRIGRITPAGVITEFPVPADDSRPNGIAAGPDGNLWFAEFYGNQIGRITTAGVITEFPVRTPRGYPYAIAAGPDGNLWFTEPDANQIGRITPTGTVTEFLIPTGNYILPGIAAGPDGSMWFTESSANKIGRISTRPCIRDATTLCLDIGEGPLDISAGAVGKTDILSWDAGRLSVRTLDASGLWTNTPFEGPFAGWNATAIATGSDGLSRVLWQNSDSRVGLEFVSSTGFVSTVRFAAEPGWTAIDVSVGVHGSTHLLRTSWDGKFRIASVGSSGSTTEGPTYGPYSGWSARAIDDGPDGTWVLWQHTDGTPGIARYREGTFETSFRWAANPGWAVEDIAVGRDGFPRVLWSNSDGRMGIATVDTQGHLLNRKVYNRFQQRARRLTASPDGQTRVLWTGVDHGWLSILNPDNSVESELPTPARD